MIIKTSIVLWLYPDLHPLCFADSSGISLYVIAFFSSFLLQLHLRKTKGIVFLSCKGETTMIPVTYPCNYSYSSSPSCAFGVTEIEKSQLIKIYRNSSLLYFFAFYLDQIKIAMLLPRLVHNRSR